MRRGYFPPPVLIILAIIIFAVAILIAINTDLVKRIKKEPSPTPVSSPTLSPSPTTQQSTPSPNETANPNSIGGNWKTYENGNFKFSLKYPDSWMLEDSGYEPARGNRVSGGQTINIKHSKASSRFEGGPNIEIYICEGGCGGSLGEGYILIEKKELSISGREATQLKLGGVDQSKVELIETRIQVSFNNQIHWIDIEAFPNDSPELVDQILSTFQFID